MTDIVDDLHDALAERQKVMKGGGGLYRRAADEIERLRDVHDRIGDYVTRHHLDQRMGREVLNIIAEHGGRAVTDAKEEA